MDAQVTGLISECGLDDFRELFAAEGLTDCTSFAALTGWDIDALASGWGLKAGPKAKFRALCDRCRTESPAISASTTRDVSEADRALVEGLPTPLARALGEVLRPSSPIYTNANATNAVDVLLRFLALACYADYLHNPDWQDPAINERFARLQDLGALGHWREFIDGYIKAIKSRPGHSPFLRELPEAWRESEHKKPVSSARQQCDRYGRMTIHVTSLGCSEWLVNRRNLLAHHHIHTGDEKAAEEHRNQCLELFRAHRYLSRYELWTGTAARAFLLRGPVIQAVSTAPPAFLGEEREVALSQSERSRDSGEDHILLPPLMLDFASLATTAEGASAGDSEVVMLDVIRDNVANYRVPVPDLKGKSGREVGRLRQLGEAKEYAQLQRDELRADELLRRVVTATDRTFRVLKSSGKYDPTLHVQRAEYEPRLQPWIDSMLPLLGIAAGAGSGKTGVFASLVGEWRKRPDTCVLFLLASQYQDIADLDRIVQRSLVLDEDVSVIDVSKALGGLIIVLDGINEHPNRADLMYRIRQHASGSLDSSSGPRFALSWRSESAEWIAPSLEWTALWWTPEEIHDQWQERVRAAVSGQDQQHDESDAGSRGRRDRGDPEMQMPEQPKITAMRSGHMSITTGARPGNRESRDRKCFVLIGGLTDQECAEAWRRYRDRRDLRMSPRFDWHTLVERNSMLARRLRDNPLELRLAMRCLNDRGISDALDEMHVFAHYLDGLRAEFKGQHVAELLEVLGAMMLRSRTIRFSRDDLRRECPNLIEPRGSTSALIVLEEEGVVTSLDRRSYTFAVERLAEQIVGEHVAARDEHAKSGRSLAHFAATLVRSKFAQAHGVVQVALDQRIRDCGRDAGDQMLLDFIDGCPPDVAALATLALESRVLEMGEEGAGSLASWMLERPSESDVEVVIQTSKRLAARGRPQLACALLQPFVTDARHDAARGPIRHAQLACEYVNCVSRALDSSPEDVDAVELVSQITSCLSHLRERDRAESTGEGLQLLARALLAASSIEAAADGHLDCGALGEEAVAACRRYVAHALERSGATRDDAIRQLSDCLHDAGVGAARRGNDARAEQLLRDALDESARMASEAAWDPSPTHWHLSLIYERCGQHEVRLDHLLKCRDGELTRRRWGHAVITCSEIGDALVSIGDEGRGIEECRRAVELADRHASQRHRAVARERLGDTLRKAKRLEEALEAYQQSYDTGMHPERVANWYPAVPLADAGDVLGQLGRWDEAIAKHEQAIDTWRQDGDRREVAIALERLGDVLRKAKRLEEALDAYQQSHETGMNPERADDWSPASCLYETARTLALLKRWDEAISKHHSSIAELRQNGDRRGVAIGLERLGDTLHEAGRLEEALDAYQHSYDTGMNPERVKRWHPAVPLADAATVLGLLGRWDEAIKRHQEAIELWRQNGDRRGLAIGIERLGDALQEAGRLEEALEAYQQSYDTGMNPERIANWYPAVPLADAGDVLGQLGRWDEAIAKHHEAIAARRQDGDRRRLATAIERLGDTLGEAGRLEEALDAYQQSYETGMNPERAEDWSPASCLYETARTLTSLKRWDEALAKHHQAIAIQRQDGDRRSLAIGLERLGDTLQEAGRLEEALDAYQQSYETGMNPERIANWYPAVPLADAGDVLGQLGRWDEAIAKHEQAIDTRRQDGDRRGIAIGLERLGDTLRQAGRFEEALRVYEQSYETGMTPERAEDWSPASCLYETARTLTSLKRWDEAISKHNSSIAELRQDGDQRGLAIGLERLGDTLQEAGRLEEALTTYLESCDTGEKDDLWNPGRCLAETAKVLRRLGREGEALAKQSKSIEALRSSDFGDPEALVHELHSYGAQLLNTNRHEEGVAATQEAVALCADLSLEYPQLLSDCQGNTSHVLYELGRPKEAAEGARQCVETTRQQSDASDDLALRIEWLGYMLREVPQLEDALDAFMEAYRVGTSCTAPGSWWDWNTLGLIADVLGRLGRWDEALGYHERSLEAVVRDGNRLHTARGYEEYGDALKRVGRQTDAVDAYRKAFDAGTLPEPLDDWDPVGALRKATEVLIAYGDPHDAVNLLRSAYLRIGATDTDGRIDPASDRAIPLSTELARALHASGQTIAALESMHSVRPAAERCCTETAASVELADAAAAWWKLHSELWQALGDDREAVASDRWWQRLNRLRTSQPAAEAG